MPNGFVVAGTQSGVGKTTITLGLLAALVRRGLRVSACKIGPDFIDPGHHTHITGKRSRNLDSWMLSEEVNRAIFARQALKSDLVVVEGVMGLFDGVGPAGGPGSTAQMAKWLSLPVLLVINARGLAQSAAAIVQGFSQFDAGVNIKWVVFNGIGSANHLQILKDSIAHLPCITCLGGIKKDEKLSLPHRHLGLVTAEDTALTPSQIQKLAELMEGSLNIDLLLQDLKADLDITGLQRREILWSSGPNRAVPIGVARDKAFCFYYQENLELLERAGAELVFFSPLQDTRLPEGVLGLYLGGGYPELYAAELEANVSMRRGILQAFEAGMPIYAECGGFMYLCRHIQTHTGNHEMVGVFPFDTHLLNRFAALGYREVCLKAQCILGKAQERIRGHEFHYSVLKPHEGPNGVTQVYDVLNGRMQSLGLEGFYIKNALGSYVHLHFASNPQVAEAFVHACEGANVISKEY